MVYFSSHMPVAATPNAADPNSNPLAPHLLTTNVNDIIPMQMIIQAMNILGIFCLLVLCPPITV